MARSRLSAEEFDALDQACWAALGGPCGCSGIGQMCERDEAQMDLLAWAMGNVLENGTPMIEEWKANRKLRIEFPFLFQAKWPEGKP